VTKRNRRRDKGVQKARPPQFRAQGKCESCGRYRLLAEACWFCYPAWPPSCICDVDLAPGPAMGAHRHLEHELLERLSQLDYESIDETILLPTDEWPSSDADVVSFEHEELVGITEGGEGHVARRYRPARPSWRDAPEYKAFLKRYPDLRRRASQGIDSIFAFFELTTSEADVWSLDAAGYTPEWIAERLRYKPGGVTQLLESVESKVHAKLARLDRAYAAAG